MRIEININQLNQILEEYFGLPVQIDSYSTSFDKTGENNRKLIGAGTVFDISGIVHNDSIQKLFPYIMKIK